MGDRLSPILYQSQKPRGRWAAGQGFLPPGNASLSRIVKEGPVQNANAEHPVQKARGTKT